MQYHEYSGRGGENPSRDSPVGVIYAAICLRAVPRPQPLSPLGWLTTRLLTTQSRTPMFTSMLVSGAAASRSAQSGLILEIFSNWLGGRGVFRSAELGAHLRQLPLTFAFVREKFNPVQVDRPITDFPSNSDRLIGAWVFEFDFDMTSHRQVGSGKQTNTAFAQPDAAPVDHGFVR